MAIFVLIMLIPLIFWDIILFKDVYYFGYYKLEVNFFFTDKVKIFYNFVNGIITKNYADVLGEMP